MKKILSILLSAMMIAGASLPMTAFAANYTNSVGSAASDIAVMSDSSYTVQGKDTTQNKKSTYSTVTYAGEDITSDCDVYATIAEGSKVYDPTNENADEDGFVNGDILVGVPTELIMNGTANNDGYYVAEGSYKVKGNISGTTVINVEADDSFKMHSIGKDDINATVSQDYTKFVVSTSSLTGSDVNKHVTPAFNDDAVGKVTVKTNEATAGSWAGTFAFEISTSTQN